MKSEYTVGLASRLREMGNGLLLEADGLEKRESLPEMVRAIVSKLGLRKAAWSLDVDVSTVRRWMRGMPMLSSNRIKVEKLYHELFG